MIVSEIFYGLKCNRCGEVYEDGEHSFWSDESSAIENAIESEWHEEKGKHYCTNCHSKSEENDDVVVFGEFPQILKTLNKFIDSVAFGTARYVSENETEFTVKCRFYKNQKLKEFEELFIKQLLGEKFISLEYEEGKYNSWTCFIKLKK